MEQEHSWDKVWSKFKAVWVVFSTLLSLAVLSFGAGVLARQLGWLESKAAGTAKPVAFTGRAEASPAIIWPKKTSGRPLRSLESIQKQLERHKALQRFISEAKSKEYPYRFKLSLEYRPGDSAFFYLASVQAQNCGCGGRPLGTDGLRLFLNPYDGEILLVDTLRNIPLALAGLD